MGNVPIDKILQIPEFQRVKKVMETDNVLAYYHTKPHWETHIVVVPKKHVDSLLTIKDNFLIIELIETIQKVASIVNKGKDECGVLTNLGNFQDSKHLHFHIYAGKETNQKID